MWWTEFFAILDCFLPFYPTNNSKNQTFEKLKKTHGDIILHKCTKNHDHMLYCSLDIAHSGFNSYFSFWAIFCPFTSLTAQKIKILKEWKKCLEISFYICIPKIMIRWCTVREICCVTDRQMGGQTDGWMDSRMDRWPTEWWANGLTDGQTDRQMEGWTDGQMDGRKKWHIEVGAPPKNMI